MDLIRPVAVTDAVLTSSTVPEAAPAAWSGATTYAIDATASIASGTVRDVYVSLAGANTNHAPASSPTWWKLIGSTYAEYSGAATYAIDEVVLSAAGHRLYRSLTAGNTGHALTDTTNWQDFGPSNRWKMFDQSVGSQTEAPEQIEVVLAPGVRIDTLVLLQLDAAAVHVVMTDPADGVVYDETFNLVSTSGITSWYDYFYEPVVQQTYLLVGDLPRYSTATLKVTISAPGGIARCGVSVVGLARRLGDTEAGASVGIQDYSVKAPDDFGNFNVVERAYSDRGNFTIYMPKGLVDQAKTLLAQYRAKPVVYVGSAEYGATIIYGFFRDFQIELSYPEVSVCSIEIEGLT